MNKILNIVAFFMFAGGGTAVIYGLLNRQKIKPVYSSTLAKNHFGQRITYKTPSGNKIRGYNFPDDINKLSFPIAIITKIDIDGIKDSAAFIVQKGKNIDKPIEYSKPDGTIVNLTYDELKKIALIA